MNKESEDNLGRRLFDQCLMLFINPELESRYMKKTFERPYPYSIAQVIFSPDGKRTEVRFDAEASAKIFIQLKEVAAPDRDQVYAYGDIEAIMDVEFDRTIYPDHAHATFFRQGDQFWHALYDLRFNKDLSARHLANARMFFMVAEDAQRRQHWPPFIDNLYSACELTARATLLAIPDKEFRDKATHKAIKSKFNLFFIRGEVPEKHQAAFNKLYALRDNARYMRGPSDITEQDAVHLLGAVKEMIEQAEVQLEPL